LPEDDENETLNSKGFDVIYDDTINKFREISGIKNSKYGVSVFLTKQIKKEIICRNNANINLKEDLFKYFIGNRLIDMYSLWEKVFTYFVVTNDTESIRKFESSIHKQIELIKIKDNETTLSKILCKWKQGSVISFSLYLDSVFKNKHKLVQNQAPV